MSQRQRRGGVLHCEQAVASLGITSILLAACAPFELVDGDAGAKAAMRPRDLQARISTNEGLTLLSWQRDAPLDPNLGAAAVRVGDTFVAVEALRAATFTAGDAERDGVLLDGAHPRLDLRLTWLRGGEEASSVEAVSAAWGLEAHFNPTNTQVEVHFTDPLAVGDAAVERPIEVEVREVGCQTTLSTSELSISGGGVAAPPILNDSGEYCVVARSEGAELSTPVRARVELEGIAHRYAPTVFRSPIIIVPIFDLALPQDGRCAIVQDKVRAALAATATELDPNATLTDSIELASGPDGGDTCVRQTWPWLDWQPIADRLTPFWDADPEPAALIVYIRNLEQELDWSLVSAFSTIASTAAVEGHALSWVQLGPYTNYFSFLDNEPWSYSSDPLMFERLAAMLERTVPFVRHVHDNAAPLELLSAERAATALGLKLCALSQEVNFAEPMSPYLPLDGSAVRYWVNIPTDFVSAPLFTPVTLSIDAEICRHYCQRGAPSWFERLECGE